MAQIQHKFSQQVQMITLLLAGDLKWPRHLLSAWFLLKAFHCILLQLVFIVQRVIKHGSNCIISLKLIIDP